MTTALFFSAKVGKKTFMNIYIFQSLLQMLFLFFPPNVLMSFLFCKRWSILRFYIYIYAFFKMLKFELQDCFQGTSAHRFQKGRFGPAAEEREGRERITELELSGKQLNYLTLVTAAPNSQHDWKLITVQPHITHTHTHCLNKVKAPPDQITDRTENSPMMKTPISALLNMLLIGLVWI